MKIIKYWLMKNEPEDFSIDDLMAAPEQTTTWDGVRNYQVRNFMRDEMNPGDMAFFYHSNCAVPGIVGTMEIVSEAYPDHTAFDPSAKYYDPKSDPENPRWLMVDVQFRRKLENMVSLADLRAEKSLVEMRVLQRGNRLSVTPVTLAQWNRILEMADNKQ